MSVFHYEKDQQNIITITMDMPGPVNAMNQMYRNAMEETLDKLEAEKDLRGVIITSAKTTFFAGGDLNEILDAKPNDTASFNLTVEKMKNDLRRLERLGVPVVAAINGAALGGGCEITLACNHRIIVNKPSAVIGLPEVTLGLLPGAGGIVRLIHRIGLKNALPLLLQGRQLKPSKALEAGLVDALVDSDEELIPAAKSWIMESDQSAGVQPWDKKGHVIPGGTVAQPELAMFVNGTAAMTQKQTRGLLPAANRIIAVAAEATQLSFDGALVVETRGLTELALSKEAKNIVNTMFFQLNDINGGKSRPQAIEPTTVNKVAVIGAGMMGQGIAYVSAMAGIEVMLLDVSLESAQKGKAYSEKLLDKAINRGRSTEEKKQRVLDLITPTDSYDELVEIDLVIEAVFENADLKAKVTHSAEPRLATDGVYSTNTSTLPITMLAAAAQKPENFIGIHFFSPVDKMPLIEIICGEKTSDYALAKAFDYARRIKKTPIVVNDSVGFFTSRTFGSYFDEGCRLLEDGVNPAVIENLGKQIGMPVGPLAVLDEVSLELMRKVNETQRELNLFSSTYNAETGDRIGSLLISEYGRGGRQYNGGFYEYPEDGDKYLWPKLYELFYKPDLSMPLDDIKDRLLFRQVIETIKCLQEGVLSSVADGNVGSLFGIGAPTWTGGWLQMINTYGLERFAERCKELAERYGEIFNPPALLLEKIERGESFQ